MKTWVFAKPVNIMHAPALVANVRAPSISCSRLSKVILGPEIILQVGL